jgi:hypothetical protein
MPSNQLDVYALAQAIHGSRRGQGWGWEVLTEAERAPLIAEAQALLPHLPDQRQAGRQDVIDVVTSDDFTLKLHARAQVRSGRRVDIMSLEDDVAATLREVLAPFRPAREVRAHPAATGSTT